MSVAAGERAGEVEEAQPARATQSGEGSERKTRERGPRPPRRTAPRRAPLPKAKRELLVSIDPGEKRVAVLEDGQVAEVYLERPEHRSIAGNIYLGTVDNVLPGMEAAFVEIGLEKNGFLYVDEIVGPELEGRRGARKIQDLIQRGQSVLVQAVKDPMKTKGARLTTEISLPGRFVVYVPQGDGLGVSRRLDDDERARLKAIVKEIAPATGGVIVRTAAEGASAEDVARDLEFLSRLWETIEVRARKAQAPTLIYQEAELPLRVTRDLFTGDFERLLVDHDRTHKRIVGYLKKTSPHMVDRVTRYREREPLLEAFGVEQEIRSTLNRRVDLPSGGYLIFDYAEAFTVIDVNTGRFVGSRSKRNGPGRLEDTITKNNLEAVKEVVRQLRLRDVGGIIVIDFIDMANPKNRQQVEDALRQELERDRTKTYVVEISPLGLVEMTRQNVTDGPREVMTRKCPTCMGDGIIVSEGTAAAEVERNLRRLVTPGARSKAFKVELNAKVANLLVGSDGSRLQELEDVTKRRFFFVAVSDASLEHLRVLDQGTVESLSPTSPVAVGDQVEVRLGEVGLHDPHAGVGKVDGIDVIVADASKLVGKRVRARIVAVMEGVAYAVHGEAQTPDSQPITAEAEAERPTRARRPIRRGAAAVVEEDEEAETLDLDEPEPDEPEPESRETARRPPRRRARKPITAAGSAVEKPHDEGLPDELAEAALELEGGDAEAEGPESDEDASGSGVPAARKRTRRGTRGGRNRRRKPAATDSGENGSGPGADTAEGEDELPEAELEGATLEGVTDEATNDETEPLEVLAEETEPLEVLAGDSPAPIIHLPEPDLGRNGDRAGRPDGTPARAGTRRGSRGGRNRRRRPEQSPADAEAAGALEASADQPTAPDSEPELAPVESGEAVTAVKEPETWDYTPMSEWQSD